MCDFNNGFILCSCKNVTPPHTSRRLRREEKKLGLIEYQWTLYTGVGEIADGLFPFPVDDLGSGLTKEHVLFLLNEGNCFDFAYTPEEGDTLRITKSPGGDFFSFLFYNREWVIDFFCNNIFREVFDKGKVNPA